MREIIRKLIIDSLTSKIPDFTRRDVRLPSIPRKAFAVIGMRRTGKTTFLWQCLADRFASKTPRDALLFLNFEDERLAGLTSKDLNIVIEEYYTLHPEYRDSRRISLFLDEIQAVPGWEAFTRRIMDTEQIDLFLSGSSAKLLSRELATSMRGRGMEVPVYPFSFRESLRHAGVEPQKPWQSISKAARSGLDNRLRSYLEAGGFPEAQGLNDADRVRMLRTYVDVAVLRDVIERHAVSNPVALRRLHKHLLSNPGGAFSIQKFYDSIRSQGVPVGKDTLHEYLGYLEDTFLVRTISIHTDSERRRTVNPRKAYPVDTGLIRAYDRSGRPNTGRVLETAVMIELERRGLETAYVRTRDGLEVDFITTTPGGKKQLVQVCADLTNQDTRERELRGIEAARNEYPDAEQMLLTLDSTPPSPGLPEPIKWLPVAQWLLN